MNMYICDLYKPHGKGMRYAHSVELFPVHQRCNKERLPLNTALVVRGFTPVFLATHWCVAHQVKKPQVNIPGSTEPPAKGQTLGASEGTDTQDNKGSNTFVLTTTSVPSSQDWARCKALQSRRTIKPFLGSHCAQLQSPALPHCSSKITPNHTKMARESPAGQVGTLLPLSGCSLGSHKTSKGERKEIINKITAPGHQVQGNFISPYCPFPRQTSKPWGQPRQRRRWEAASPLRLWPQAL